MAVNPAFYELRSDTILFRKHFVFKKLSDADPDVTTTDPSVTGTKTATATSTVISAASPFSFSLLPLLAIMLLFF